MEKPAPKLLEKVREVLRLKHDSPKTEESDVHWIRQVVRYDHLRHPRELGAPEVEAFLTHLAVERKVSSSTQNQAVSALLFLYREVLNIDLEIRVKVIRPRQSRSVPVVLTRAEVQAVLSQMSGVCGLMAKLLRGSGQRPAIERVRTVACQRPGLWQSSDYRPRREGRTRSCYAAAR